MNENTKNYYGKEYYETYKSEGGEEYERGHGWEEVFGRVADRIVKEINPKRVLDVGCAKGFLVEALRDRGVEAYGIDISEYAISEVREDIRPYCKAQSLLDGIEGKYDLITCIEVLEHFEGKDIARAIQIMCEATKDIIFSSTPFEFEEESHVSVHLPDFWVEKFAYNGFYHDIQYDCSFVSIQAMRMTKSEKTIIGLIREYEKEFFQKHQELVAVRHQSQLNQENVQIYKDAYQKHVDIINNELNPQINGLNQKIIEKDQEILKRNQEIQEKNQEIQEKNQEIQEKNKEVSNCKEENRVINLQLFDEVKQRKLFQERAFGAEDHIETIRRTLEDQNHLVKDQKEVIDNQKEVIDNQKEVIDNQKEVIDNQKEVIDSQQGVIDNQRGIIDNQSGIIEIIKDSVFQLKKGLCLREDESVIDTFKDVYRRKKAHQRQSRSLLLKGEEYWKPVFDFQCYREYNSDIAETIGDNQEMLLKHFVLHGMAEGRRANKEFDICAYICYNPDVVQKCQNDIRAYYLHYIDYGKAEGRRCL